jgi:hypothetical protein
MKRSKEYKERFKVDKKAWDKKKRLRRKLILCGCSVPASKISKRDVLALACVMFFMGNIEEK